MGLIKAVLGSAMGTLADTWKDYYVCDSLSDDVLMVKGTRKGYSGNSDIITNGSGIVVNEGQCALIIEEGNVLEVACEPGNYTFDSSITPSVFDGGFEGIKKTFQEMVERFKFGGDAHHQQRVYYVNTKEIMGNMYGTATPIPFRVIDKNLNLDVEMPIRCNGEYSFKIVNPLVFYQKVAGNQAGYFTKEDLVKQMRSEMLTALQPAFSKIAEAGVRYSEVPAHVDDLASALKEALAVKWTENRGIDFCSIGVNSVSMDPENEKKIRDLQLAAVNKDVNMATATLTTATADAMRDAANNPNGAANAFFATNMAANGANGVASLLQSQVANQQFANAGAVAYCPNCGNPVDPNANFCSKCGTKLK